MLELKLSKFNGQLKLKPETEDDHQIINDLSSDLCFRKNGNDKQATGRQNPKETEAHLECLVLKTKSEENKWLYLSLRFGALVIDAFARGPPMIVKIHEYTHRAWIEQIKGEISPLCSWIE